MKTNKTNWLRLAQSPNAEDRQIAYQIAIGEPTVYQFELFILYLLTNSPAYHFEIYSMLEEEYREKINQYYNIDIKQYPEGNISDILPNIEDAYTLKVVIEMLNEDQDPLFHKILFIKKYRQYANCGLKEAKQVADAFWHKAGK